MAKKPKHRHHPGLTLPELRGRVDKAVREGRFQQALELAKQLFKQDASAAHKELLLGVYLGRARQLRQQGYNRDAGEVLNYAVSLGDGDPTWLAQVIEELASAGHVQRALDLAARLPGSDVRGRLLPQAVDTALQQGSSGHAVLPEELKAQFYLVRRAFTQLEAGQDDQVRETLQGIGLQSPFLEWKLLLRGLLAYYQKDDERALENWQRLNPERVPARLAAPFRFLIDPGYRQAQPPEVRNALQKQVDRLQTASFTQSLRAIQAALAHADRLPQAFRLAEQALPVLRNEVPSIIPRLGICFHWAIIAHGQPEDVGRYERVFGAPADDPRLARLRALLLEHVGDMTKAHQAWQQFEQSVASNQAAWPGELGNRARALVWCRMGHNAAAVPDVDKIPNLPPILRDHPDRPRPLHPPAELCYKRSLELAPDQLETHEALFHYYLEEDKGSKAVASALELLERFPEHVPTLTALGDLYMKQEKHGEALAIFQRALKANPLDRQLRGRVGTAHLFHARAHAEAGRFDAARAEYQAARALEFGRDMTLLCKWAACEFKAGDTARAEELIQQALGDSSHRLGVAYNMLIETIRLKLPRALKNRFDREFKEGLAQPPTPVAAVDLAEAASAHRLAGVTYHGQKTHEKKVLAYLDKAYEVEFSEDQLEILCLGLLGLSAIKLLRSFAKHGQHHFPRNPFFFYVDAESYIAQGPQRCPYWKVMPLLKTAHQLAAEAPAESKHRGLLETIQEREDMIGTLTPFGGPGMGMFGDLFERMFDTFGDEYDDEDDMDDMW